MSENTGKRATTTKRDLVTRIAEDVPGVTQQQVYQVVQQTLDRITDALAEGSNVELRNFGVFEVKSRKQRIGRNPNKPEQVVTIPERKVVKFKPGKIMKINVADGITMGEANETASAAPAAPPAGDTPPADPFHNVGGDDPLKI